VIDASIALSWCFEDEATPETDQLFESVRDEGAAVPLFTKHEPLARAAGRRGIAVRA
jgi:hypothetical protein